MNNLTFWAKSHARAAQIIIAIGHILTVYLSIQLGILLLTMGIESPHWLVYVFAELLILTIWFYPYRKGYDTSKQFNAKRRYFDIALLSIGVFLSIFFANQLASDALDSAMSLTGNENINVAPAKSLTTLVIYQSTKTVDKEVLKNSISTKKQGKLQQWVQKNLVSKYQLFSSKAPTKGGKIALTILLLVGIVALEYLIFALSCSLACNGMNALSILVILGGLLGLSALVVWALRGIFPEMTKKRRIGTAFIMVVAPPLLLFLISFIRNA